MLDASTVFSGGVNMLNAFTNGEVGVIDLTFAFIAGSVGIFLVGRVLNVVR